MVLTKKLSNSASFRFVKLLSLLNIILISVSSLNAQSTRITQQWMQLADKEVNPNQALIYYQQVLVLNPTGPIAAEAYNSSAVVRSGPNVKAFKEALEDVEKAIFNDPRKAKFYAQRAYIYIQIFEYQRALESYKAAIERAPNEADYYSGLSYCQNKHGQFEQAEATAQRGINLNPQSPYPFRNRGRARLRQNKEDAAIEDFKKCINLKHGQIYRVYCDMGEAYEQKGEMQLALSYYEKSLKIEPDYADAMVGKNQLEHKLKMGTLSVKIPAATFEGKRVALLVGNSGYNIMRKLGGQPVKDALAMKIRLKELGFDTLTAINANSKETTEKLGLFYEKAKDADVALIFFAGHGINHKGENFLLPIDVPHVNSDNFGSYAFSVTQLIDKLQYQNPKYCIFILDACRDDPFADPAMQTATFQSFKLIYVENKIENCYVALATAGGAFAYQSAEQHGYYTSAILNNLKKGRTLNEIFQAVRGEVMIKTKKQNPVQRPELINRTMVDLVM